MNDDWRLVWRGLNIAQERDLLNSESLEVEYFGQGERRGGSTVYLYGRDHLGSVVDVWDDSGDLAAHYDYEPYGRRTLQVQDGDFETAMGFTGHYTLRIGWNEGEDLVLAPYRAYDPELGRWISRDPIKEDGGINLYAYVGNNPVNYTDPTGLLAPPDHGELPPGVQFFDIIYTPSTSDTIFRRWYYANETYIKYRGTIRPINGDSRTNLMYIYLRNEHYYENIGTIVSGSGSPYINKVWPIEAYVHPIVMESELIHEVFHYENHQTVYNNICRLKNFDYINAKRELDAYTVQFNWIESQRKIHNITFNKDTLDYLQHYINKRNYYLGIVVMEESRMIARLAESSWNRYYIRINQFPLHRSNIFLPI